MLVKWSNVAVGTTVVLGGKEYKLLEAKTKKKGIRVTVNAKFGEFSNMVDPDDKVEVRVGDPRLDRFVGRVLDGAKKKEALAVAERQRELAAKGRWKPDPVDVEYVKKASKKAAKKSKHIASAKVVEDKTSKPSRGEKVVREVMSAVPIATHNLKSEYVLPFPTPSTIEAHLHLFHHVDPAETSWPTSYAEQVARHDALHAQGDVTPFHRHEKAK